MRCFLSGADDSVAIVQTPRAHPDSSVSSREGRASVCSPTGQARLRDGWRRERQVRQDAGAGAAGGGGGAGDGSAASGVLAAGATRPARQAAWVSAPSP